jgi:hypothetical protein
MEAHVTVNRFHEGHRTRYELRDGSGPRCTLIYDAGEEGQGPVTWKILLPGPAGTWDLYGSHQVDQPDAATLARWVEPFVGHEAAAEIASAVVASPPAPAG